MKGHRFCFFAEKTLDAWTISSEELHHLARVLRLKVGDEVEVFDGKGNWAFGTLAELGRESAKVLELNSVAQPAAKESFLGLGALKPSDLDELLPYLVELGVSDLHFFRHDKDAHFRVSEKQMQRWHRIMVAACKQCKRAFLPRIQVFEDLESLLATWTDAEIGMVFLHPDGETGLMQKAARSESKEKKSGVIVSSEAGFSSSELSFLKKCDVPARSLGTAILRAKTAAIAAAIWLQFW